MGQYMLAPSFALLPGAGICSRNHAPKEIKCIRYVYMGWIGSDHFVYPLDLEGWPGGPEEQWERFRSRLICESSSS